jgi:hypothetical protein
MTTTNETRQRARIMRETTCDDTIDQRLRALRAYVRTHHNRWFWVFDDADVAQSTRTTRLRSYYTNDPTIEHTIDDIMQYARSLRIKLTRRDARMRHAFARTSIVLQFTRRHVDDDAARIARAQRASRRVANTRLWEVIVDIDGDVDVDVDA